MNSIDGLGEAIVDLQNLRYLKLNFLQCSNITSIDELLNGIMMFQSNKFYTSLKLLELNFKESGLSEYSIKKFLKKICSETMTFRQCRMHLNFEPEIDLQSVTNVDDLNAALKSGICPCDNCVIV